METAFSKFMRFLWWPVVVIAAANIEAWATKSGYGLLLTSHLDPNSDLGLLLATLTDPLTTHVAAFIAGGAVLSWLSYWFELLEYRHGGPPHWMLKNHILVAKDALKKGKKRHFGTTVKSHCEKANKALISLSLYGIDEQVHNNDIIREEYVVYLTSVYALLDGKHFEAAKSTSDMYEQRIKVLIGQLQSPLSIGSGTPP